MDTTWFLWSSLFSLIGFAIFVYGRRQRRVSPTLAGIALMMYPYFVSSVLAGISIGVLLIGAMILGNRFEDGL